MPESQTISTRRQFLLNVALAGGVGGAVNAALCWLHLPPSRVFARSYSFQWHVVPAGFVHGTLLAWSAAALALALRRKPVWMQLAAAPFLGWLAGHYAWQPILLSFGERWPGAAMTWVPPLDGLWNFWRAFGLVPVLYFALGGIFRLLESPLLKVQIAVGVASGVVGSLPFWLSIEPWYFSLIHGSVWGALVGLAAGKAHCERSSLKKNQPADSAASGANAQANASSRKRLPIVEFLQSNRRILAAAVTSAVLLIASFPSWNLWPLAWVALVPWLSFLPNVSSRAAFGWSSLVGCLFFLASMHWLTHVTSAGWITLGLYLGLYFGAFGWLAHRASTLPSGLRSLWIASCWTSLEFLRSHFLSGLGWNLIAYSQSRWIDIIQLAEWTGVWGVSFLIVWVNALFARAWREREFARRSAALITLGIVMIALTAWMGRDRWRGLQATDHVRVGLVQGNSPREVKWRRAYEDFIIGRYSDLTASLNGNKADLIVWPETSVPGYLGMDENVTQWVLRLAREAKTPVLAGAPMLRVPQMVLVNRAVLIEPNGVLDQHYDKMHLVPFGEFVPLEDKLPWLRAVLPPIGTFASGEHATVFALQKPGAAARRFSVLICFEDVFPEIARGFVYDGAEFLLVITNDAWFGATGAAYQHAQASTFRAVELRVPIARAANTGWSGCINSAGRWIGAVRDASGRELFVSGTHVCDLKLTPRRTLYAAWGDWFAIACCALAALGLLVSAAPRRRALAS